ncbi:MAG: hypothetical protein HYX20_04275 [Candidatus Yanofskybacteria bacterium]|nr:hypothetical protein [Candidatus Yanofskybacteria bacterium]
MKIAVFLSTYIILCSNICPAQTAKHFNNKARFGVEFRLLNFDFGPSNTKFSGLPLSMRQIPVHPDDGYLGLTGKIITVPSDTIKQGLLTAYSPTVAPEIRVSRFKLRAGISTLIPFLPKAKTANNGSTREIHQYDSGTSRGVGTSLVFYAIEASPNPKLGWLAETEFLAKDYISFLGGYAVSEYNLRVRTGWDRFNQLETYKNYPLASNQIQKKYLGARFKPPDSQTSFLVLGGIYNQNNHLEATSAQIKIDSGSSYFLSIGISFTFGKNN